jgi:hypothetical protein
MKNLPLGIQTYSKLIKGKYLYVDKTQEIYKLVSNGGGYYFLSRPRRFGKSLLISTLKVLFSGDKELFKGLWIYDKTTSKTYPVIHIDFSQISFHPPQTLEKALNLKLERIAQNHKIELD